MKWLLGAAILVGAVWLWTLQGPADAPDQGLKSVLEAQPEKAPEPFWQATPDDSGNAMDQPARMDQSQDSAPVSEGADRDQVINIGEPMDPDDPSTWPQPENTQVINIGEPMDPDDPSTWPQPENTEVINIGEPMDQDDPSTWPQPENTEVINIGEPMDPDDPSAWPQPESTEVINIGKPMDPDDPSTWD